MTRPILSLCALALAALSCLMPPSIAPGVVAEDAAETVRRRTYHAISTPAPVWYDGEKRMP